MGCGPSRSVSVTDAAPNPYLKYYALPDLGSRDVFGPFLNLSPQVEPHDHADAGSYRLSVLVVCTEAANLRSVEARSKSLPGTDGKPQQPGVSWTVGKSGSLSNGKDAKPAAAAEAALHTAEGELLYSWRNWQFWRCQFQATLEAWPQELRYQVDLLPGRTFSVAVPARGAPWHWAFYSCNGLHNPDNAARAGGMEPLWADLVARHAQQPLHCLVGGGDQIYNDGVFNGPLLMGWDRTVSGVEANAKAEVPFTDAMRDEVEEFYFSHYCAHFSQPHYCDALASIPSANMWDDHDIFDGWGSYPDNIQASGVMQGTYAAARLFFHLFQLHTTPDRAAAEGRWCGACGLHRLGETTVLVAADGRSFRTQARVCHPDFAGELGARLRALPPSVRHVVLLLGVPILYPKLGVIGALERLGRELDEHDEELQAFLSVVPIRRYLPLRFGEVNILDDLVDHWDAPTHVAERDDLLRLLQDVAREKGVRVTFISGDVHCGGYGMFHGAGGVPAGDVDKVPPPGAAALASDPRFMPQVISSAIVNVPPPKAVLAMIRKLGAGPQPVLQDCVGRLVSLVPGDAEGDQLLLGRRNWCEVTGGGADGGGGGGGGGSLRFELRVEQKPGGGQVEAFGVEVPPLLPPTAEG